PTRYRQQYHCDANTRWAASYLRFRCMITRMGILRPTAIRAGAPVGSRCQDGRSAGTRRKAAMAAIPVSIPPNVIPSELFPISASAKTRRDRLARTEARIDELKADLARAADDLGWDAIQNEQQVAEIVRRLTDAERLASTEQFAVLNRAIELLTTHR